MGGAILTPQQTRSYRAALNAGRSSREKGVRPSVCPSFHRNQCPKTFLFRFYCYTENISDDDDDDEHKDEEICICTFCLNVSLEFSCSSRRGVRTRVMQRQRRGFQSEDELRYSPPWNCFIDI